MLPVGSTLPDVGLIDPGAARTSQRDDRRSSLRHGVLSRRLVSPLQCHVEQLPGLSRSGAHRSGGPTHRPKSAVTRWIAHHATEARSGLTVLSEPGNLLARPLGIVTAPSSEVRGETPAGFGPHDSQRGRYVFAPLADHHHPRRVPEPCKWIDVHPDYSTHSEAGDIIAALDAAELVTIPR